MEPSGWKCPYCSRILRSERGRTQHINSSPACRQQRHDEVFSQQLDQDDEPHQSRSSKRLRLANRQLGQDANLTANSGSTPPSPEASDSETVFNAPEQEDSNTDPDDENGDHGDISSAAAGTTDENTDSEPDSDPDAKPHAINTQMRAKFRAYAESHSTTFLPLNKKQETQIRLLDALKRKKAPMNAYKEVLEWHLKETGKLQPHETLRDTKEYHDRKTMLDMLIERYNLAGLVPVPVEIKLPFSKAVVTVPCRDAQDCIVALLTDPRFEIGRAHV